MRRLADVAYRVAFRRLDLDDLRALVGEQHRPVGPENDVGEIDDADAAQSAGHGVSLCDAGLYQVAALPSHAERVKSRLNPRLRQEHNVAVVRRARSV